MGGAIRIKSEEYFLNSHIRMHGENIMLFGDGQTELIYLTDKCILNDQYRKKS